MYKKIVAGLLLFGFLTTILAACAIYDESAVSGPTGHMGAANFVQQTITITKGDSLTLVDDVGVQHILKNGSWQGAKQVPATESGAPTLQRRSPLRAVRARNGSSRSRSGRSA